MMGISVPTLSRRAFLALTTTLPVVLSVAACGGRLNLPTNLPGGGAPPARLSMTNWSGVAVAALFQKLVRQFEQANPRIKVTYTPTTANYWPKLLTQAAGGDAPDVFWMNAQNLGAWVARKQLLDLSSLASGNKYDFRDFWKAGLAAYTVDGKLRALPSQVDDRGLFFNIAMFRTVGRPLPPVNYQTARWNQQDFLDACLQLTKSTSGRPPDQFGCLVPNAFITYAPWIWANGGDFMNADRTACVMTSPETVEAFQFLQDLIFKHRVAPGPNVLSTESAATLFSTGKIGMATDTISVITQYRKDANHFTWDTGALPAGKAGFANQSSGPAWSIDRHSKYPDQAWQLSSFLVSATAQETLAQGGAVLPSRVSVAKQVWEQPTGTPAHGGVFLDGMQYVHPNPFVWNWSQIETMLIKELSYLWDGSRTAEKVMQAIRPQMDKLLRQKPS